jgi:ABC-type multidrug transport system permease subunit
LSTLFSLLVKDLRRRMKAPMGILVLIAIPLALSLIFGMVFSPSNEGEIPSFTLLVVDRDSSLASGLVKSAFTQGKLADLVELREVTPEEGAGMMDAGKASALLEIPEGFGADLLDGRAVRLRLMKDPAEQYMPDIAEQIAGTLCLLLDYGSRILAGPIEKIRSQRDQTAFPGREEWNEVSDLFYHLFEGIEKYALPPVIELETGTISGEEEATGVNYFALFLPAIALMSLLFIGENGFRDLAIENEGGQLRRIFATPTRPSLILAGKVVYSVILVYASFLAMAVSGVVLFGIEFADPVLFFLGGVLVSLACTGIMGVIYTLTGQRRKGEALTSMIVIIMCMVGGSFVPIQALPEAMHVPARFTVNYWGIDLLQSAINRDLAEAGPSADILVLTGISVVTISLSALLLGRKLSKGDRP